MKNLIYVFFLSFIFCGCKQPPKSNKTMDIENKKWFLVELNGKTFSISQEGKVFLKFNKEIKKIEGFAGCNSFSGVYNLKNDAVSLSEMISTEAYCEEIMDKERAFFKVLAETKTLSVSKDNKTLFLLNESKNTLAQLKSE
ncbi:MAG: META domain-containing protein [Raineya sp.]|jgi:heat shock protein HslJ|nr:META domain-containing protein [Raineya sp.]